ncbi:MAG: apolipoprotein N-acyltransferase [Opitutaceae bacterium]
MPKPNDRLSALLVLVLTPLLAWLMFPAARAPECALIFAVPGVLWAGRAPAWRLYAWTLWAAWTLAWLLLLSWLHHVTVVGTLLLAAFLGALSGAWFLAARWALPRGGGAPAWARIATMLGLAGLWVVGEWVRGWLFTGFPWLPLAASQWQRPLLLALCPYTGAHGVSFLLMLVNLGAAAWFRQMATLRHDQPRRWFAPEFAVALAALLGGTFGLGGDFLHQRREPWFTAGIVQPYIPQTLKWDPAAAGENLRVLERETAKVAAARPDLLLWPESAVPYILKVQPQLQGWLEDNARRADAPILGGVVVMEDANLPTERWYNAAVAVDPEHGVQTEYYAKRHRVPFGEYVPLRPVLGWLRKFVPIGDDFLAGGSARPLLLSTRSRPVRAGVLICYEDVFADLSRASVAAGAEVLVNLTNNAWYGEGAAAYQHAAHSALRAAETRRPVVRCGNGGWSGWFDEFGGLREELRDERGSVYFRGGGTVALSRDVRWVGRLTPYVRHGDWFVAVCAGLALLAGLRLRRMQAE